MKRLEGKVAIITGANAGIGLQTAITFAREGANIVLAARRLDKLQEAEEKIKEFGVESISVSADVSSKEDCQKIVDKAIEKFGKIDILVNNAGIADKHKPITRCDEDWYDTIIKIDQYSVFYMMKYALVHMEKQGEGSIINVASISGIAPVGGFSYTAAKTAVIAMTQSAALQFADTNIRFNAINPGPTDTAILDPENMATFDEFKDKCAQHINLTLPMSKAQDQANAILFFASDESKAITGQYLTVDHGTTL